jgi:hypothetical protein
MNKSSQPDWTRTDRQLPTEGKDVVAIDYDGHEMPMRYKVGLWWHADMSRYVEGAPILWRYDAGVSR